MEFNLAKHIAKQDKTQQMVIQNNNGELEVLVENKNQVEYNNIKVEENKMTRIRYKNVNGLLVTTRPMLAGKHQVNVVIDVNQSPVTFEVQTLEGQTLFKGTSENGVVAAQKAAKQELKNLGVQFNDEIRQREAKCTEHCSDEPAAAFIAR
jgi:hypothetical protein